MNRVCPPAKCSMEASREFPRVMRACHVMLVNATKTCCTSMAEDLFGESLIAQDVKMAMYLNISDKEKAEKLIDCVRVIVTIAPEKIYVFIKVLRRHGGEKAAKTLEEMISGIMHCTQCLIQDPIESLSLQTLMSTLSNMIEAMFLVTPHQVIISVIIIIMDLMQNS